MTRYLALVPLALLAACDSQSPRETDPAADDVSSTAAPIPSQPNEAPPPGQPAAAWDLIASGEGASLVFPASGAQGTATAIRLFCPARSSEILVNVPAFRPIGSEERLSFGSGSAVHALVADTKGDRQRGGVSGTGAVPAGLAALIGGPVSVNYGAQNSGPHPAPPPELARAFIAACGEGGPGSTPGPAANNISACLTQDGQRLSVQPLRAVGTEPFWGARIEGRCVTYSHPEDQQGTRIWTRYSANSGGGTWTGALAGQRFVLTSRAQPGCSDGMSDKSYPLAVRLTVAGEQRRGCAEPL